jgi:hypothetical protein
MTTQIGRLKPAELAFTILKHPFQESANLVLPSLQKRLEAVRQRATNRLSGSFLIKKWGKQGLHSPTHHKRRRDHEHNQSATAVKRSIRLYPPRQDH